jgi:hypothetical protein
MTDDRCPATIWPSHADRWIRCPGTIRPDGTCTAYGTQHSTVIAEHARRHDEADQ